jgi:hypothetical protein
MIDAIHVAYQWMIRICAVGLLVDTLEQLARRRSFDDDGFYSWTILRRRLEMAPPTLRRLADALCEGSARPVAVLSVRLIALGVVVSFPVGSLCFDVALSLLLAAHLYLLLRRCGLGIEGADATNLLILGSTWLCTVVAHDATTMTAGLCFIAAQTCLAYFAYGVTKLASPTWRSGRALPAALSTYSYGHPTFHRMLADRPRVALFLCWLTMIWESCFPLVLWAPAPVRGLFFLSGVFFHAGIAVTMGIDLLLWAYAATYPAIWWVAH